MQAEDERRATNRIERYYPDSGLFRRELYGKHLQFFAAGGRHTPMECCPQGCDGSPHRERCFMAGNRCGKTEAGVYESTLHLTGRYPHWWVGKRFDRPIKAWACGDSSKTVRDILQDKFLGPWMKQGTGMVPKDLIAHRTLKAGIAETIDSLYVKHVSGDVSSLTFKSYDQRRESFQGTGIDWVFLDEECEAAIYAEALTRTMTSNGQLILCFTPLLGLSEVVLSFMPQGLPN